MKTNTTPLGTKQLRQWIREELRELIEIRRDLHAHPELGYDEHRTHGVVARELEAAGVEFRGELAGGTGLLGHLPGESDRALGLRADMDALPIVEETGAPYASTHSGVMHACGHDGHTTILLGAARVLARIRRESSLPRPVTFVFQPAEEGGAGGRRMVEEGCLDGSILGTPVESMFGLHGWPQWPLGEVGSRGGPLLAASDCFDIALRGIGCHAAFPHLGADPVVAASALVQALQSIPSRNVDPVDSIVISVTKLDAGSAYNVIPETAVLSGTVRTLTPDTHRIAQTRIQEVSDNLAKAYGCEADVDYQVGYPVTLNDPAAVSVFEKRAVDAVGSERLREVPTPVMGGEDFSFYCHKVPSCFFFLGLRPEGRETMPNLHQPTFDFNDDAIETGVEIFCRLALGDPS